MLSDNDGAMVLAGGQTLLPVMKLRLTEPSALVDISRLTELSYVKEEKSMLRIGALTTFDVIELNRTIKERFTILNDAVSKIGDQQVRNLGTIGGSACAANPDADLLPALLALDAQFVIQGRSGQRVVAAGDFFVDSLKTAVEHDEILTEIRLPCLPRGSVSAQIKHSLRETEVPIAISGVVLTVGARRACDDVRIGLGAVGLNVMRARAAESYLRGKPLDDQTIAEAAEKATEGVDPPSDMHASRDYRLEAIKVLTRRAIGLAMSRLG
jgi:carbon-monoxide dehydrogenase medium subunit